MLNRKVLINLIKQKTKLNKYKELKENYERKVNILSSLRIIIFIIMLLSFILKYYYLEFFFTYIFIITLIISMIVPYYETLKASKIGKVPPKSKIEIMKKLININKVTEIKSVTFNFCKTIV